MFAQTVCNVKNEITVSRVKMKKKKTLPEGESKEGRKETSPGGQKRAVAKHELTREHSQVFFKGE